jgi:putative YhgA-like transposase
MEVSMAVSYAQDIVRHFRENGLKLLLQHPAHARDLLTLGGYDHVAAIDFGRLGVDPTTYMAADYRHVSADLVLTAPFRGRQGKQRRSVTLYILIEHQSEPEAVMLLRVLDYLVQIYKAQLRTWEQHDGSAAGFRLQPVLPVVLYTGTVPWPALGHLTDLMDLGDTFRAVTPEFEPLFVSLPARSRTELETSGGELGWILELIQQRRAPAAQFEALVRRVVAHLEGLAPAESGRWRDLLSYLLALVYHDRGESERDRLRQLIAVSVRSEDRRREVQTMGRTIAEALRDEGRAEGRAEEAVQLRQQTLLRQLRVRFRKVPKAVEGVVLATTDTAQLDGWLDRIVTATSLSDMGFGTAS